MRFPLVTLLLLAGASIPAAAVQEFYIGEPIVKEGMQIVPNYLTGVEMDHMPSGMGMSKDSVHLEADVHATKDGQPTYKKTGILFAMTAKDGPHYANNVDMAGPGTYHLMYIISPPSSHGFIRHVDKASGVPDWWKPINLTWSFAYPSKTK